MTHKIQEARDEIYKAETALSNARHNLDEALHPSLQSIEDINIALIKESLKDGPSGLGKVEYNGSSYQIDLLPYSKDQSNIWAYESLRDLLENHGFIFRGLHQYTDEKSITIYLGK